MLSVYADGQVTAQGGAGFYGDMSGSFLSKPIVGMAATPDGKGYWLVAADGGIFTFGDANFYGSTGNITLNKPIVAMAATPDGKGYWLVAADGGIFTFGDANFYGSATNQTNGAQAVGLTSSSQGYDVVTSSGQLISFSQAVVPQSTPLLSASGDPAASISPSAAFQTYCYSPGNTAACNSAALAGIDAARAQEGLGPMALPPNFASMSVQSQLLTVTNLERTDRGLPALGENSQLDALADAGAQAGTDPSGPPGFSWGSNIAWGYATPLAADFAWMYDDGPGGTNIDCKQASDAGCWGHRDNILAPWSGQMGVAFYTQGGVVKLTQLMVDGF